jgi:hypothetical protein
MFVIGMFFSFAAIIVAAQPSGFDIDQRRPGFVTNDDNRTADMPKSRSVRFIWRGQPLSWRNVMSAFVAVDGTPTRHVSAMDVGAAIVTPFA